MGNVTVAPALRGVLYALALVAFVAVVFLRGGPSTGDAFAVVGPTTQLSHGDLGAAATAQTEYQPPGYSVLASPWVVTFRSLIGAPTWCDRDVPAFALALETTCDAGAGGEHWYRSQAVLGIVAWVALAFGCVALLGAAGFGAGLGAPLLVLALAVLPTTGDALVQTFHPQDLVCMGMVAGATALALRRRWMWAGVVFGVAFTCKQFALLALVPVLIAATPGWRERARLVVPAAVASAAVVLPFYVANRSATTQVLSALSVAGGGKFSAGTIVGLSPLSSSAKLAVARFGAIALAAAVALWARRRARGAVLAPVPLIGLVVAGLASRLVFEVWIYGYYLLAAGVALLVLDVVCWRPPVRSIIWIALTTVLVTFLADVPQSLASVLWLVASLSAVAIGLSAALGRDRVARSPAHSR